MLARYDTRESISFIIRAKGVFKDELEVKAKNLKKKLFAPRAEARLEKPEFKLSQGSRKISASRYVKDPAKLVVKKPFPTNLRSHRKKPHKIKRKSTEDYTGYVVTAEDVEAMNPVITSRQNVEILEEGKSLFRMGP